MHAACGGQKPSGSPKQEEAKAKNYLQMLFDPHLHISAVNSFQGQAAASHLHRWEGHTAGEAAALHMQVIFTAELSRPEKWCHLAASPLADTTGPTAASLWLITVLAKLSEMIQIYESIWDVTAA